jgi:hypothetical protein
MCHVRSFVFFSGVHTGVYLVQSIASDDAFQFTPSKSTAPHSSPPAKAGVSLWNGWGAPT